MNNKQVRWRSKVSHGSDDDLLHKKKIIKYVRSMDDSYGNVDLNLNRTSDTSHVHIGHRRMRRVMYT